MSSSADESVPSVEELRAAFDGADALTVGIEDEVMLLDATSFELLPRGPEVLELVLSDDSFKPELPAAHLEIVTTPAPTVKAAARELHAARSELARRAAPIGVLASAGAHPFSPGAGELNRLERYSHTLREYAPVARRQLVCALQVHVAVGDAELALAVYNAARGYLPLLAALAANAPFYEGRDTGLASVRPKLCELLPRQGVPPRIGSWEEFHDALRWGQVSGRFSPGAWWWELRPHRRFGTLEFRVPDGQTTVDEASAVAAVAQALVAWLSERRVAGERLPQVPSWRIAENRWSACRYGVDGELFDLRTGQPRSTRELLHELINELEPTAARAGASRELAIARQLVERNGAMRQHEAASEHGVLGLARWLCERFLAPLAG